MSSQGRPAERPFRPSPFQSQAARRRQDESTQECEARAWERFAIWQFQANLDQTLPVRDRFIRTRDAIRARELIAPPITQSTFYRIVAIGRAAEVSGVATDCLAFLERPRTGRPPRPLHPVLAEMLLERLRVPTTRSNAKHLRELTKEAKRRHLPEADYPSRRQVDAFKRSIPPEELATALHGRNAGMLDATPRGKVPAECTHDIWTFDEAELPIWARVLDPKDNAYRAVKPWAVFVTDNYSRAIIGFRVVRPFFRPAGSEKIWPTHRHRADDVIGTLIGAAIPEIAPDCLAQFGGYLPKTLRADVDGTHHAAAAWAKDLKIAYPELLPGKPWLRGNIERLIRTIKDGLGAITGATTLVEVAERTTEDPRRRRQRATTSLVRDRAVESIPTMDLLTVEEIESKVLEVVAEYNRTPHSRLPLLDDEEHQTPEYAYRAGLRSGVTRNAALFLKLPVKTVRVSREGVVVNKAAYSAKGVGFRYRMNDEVQCRTEPLRRAAFVVKDDGTYHTLYEMGEYAKQIQAYGLVGDEIRADRAAVIAASESAHRARRKVLGSVLGPDAVDEGARIRDARLKGEVTDKKRRSAKAGKARRAKDSAEREAAVTASEASAATPAPAPRAPQRPARPQIPMAPPFTRTVVLKFPTPPRP